MVVGDATLDVIVGGGSAVAGADRPAAIHVGPGGQGANLAVRLARRGNDVRLVTGIGTDAFGAELGDQLTAEGVEISNLGAARTGVVVALLDPAGERAMLSDRASLDEDAWSGPEAPGSQALADAGWIHVSGYPLADPRSGAALATAVGARRADQRASVGGGSFTEGTDLADRVRTVHPDLVLFDRREAAVVLGVSGSPATGSAQDLAAQLAATYDAVAVVTDGSAGAAASVGSETIFLDVVARPVVDATGVGDAYAAAVLDALAGGAWPPSGAELRRTLELAAPAGAAAASLVGAQARVPSEGGP